MLLFTSWVSCCLFTIVHLDADVVLFLACFFLQVVFWHLCAGFMLLWRLCASSGLEETCYYWLGSKLCVLLLVVRVVELCWLWLVCADCLYVGMSWLVRLPSLVAWSIFLPFWMPSMFRVCRPCLAALSELVGPIFMQVAAGVSSSGLIMGYHCHCCSFCLLPNAYSLVWETCCYWIPFWV
jgi:hypothetical protein